MTFFEFILTLILDILFSFELPVYDSEDIPLAGPSEPTEKPVFYAPSPIFALYWIAYYVITGIAFAGAKYNAFHEYVFWSGPVFWKHFAMGVFAVFDYLFHEYNEWEFNVDFYVRLYAQLFPYQVQLESSPIVSPCRFSIIDEAYRPVFPFYPKLTPGGGVKLSLYDLATSSPPPFLASAPRNFLDPSTPFIYHHGNFPKPAVVVGLQFEFDPGFVIKPFPGKSFYDDFWGISQKAAKAAKDFVVGWGPGTLPPVDKVAHAKAVNEKVKSMEDKLLEPVEVDVDSLATSPSVYSAFDLLYLGCSLFYSIFLLYYFRFLIHHYRYPLMVIYSRTVGRLFPW